MMLLSDTISAIATPRGEGGIGIIRVSGTLAIPIACQIFKSPQHRSPADFPSHTLHFGHIIDSRSGDTIDEAMLGVMRSPKSYTTEDIVEFNCHGGIMSLTAVLEQTLRSGARVAEPGEFTRRAFLNGKIDLAQAEAVIDLIRAKTNLTRRIAMDGLTGRLSQEVNGLNGRLVNLLAEVEASIDFPEEELDFLNRESLRKAALAIEDELNLLIATASAGKILREGIKVAILGKPNVGKSSLLNELLMSDRAIVTEVPGTTRDTIEVPLDLEGVPIELIDTAGIRQTEDAVEKQGVERSMNYLNLADLILMVFDAAQPLVDADIELLQAAHSRNTVLILNKVDLPILTTIENLRIHAAQCPVVQTSMLDGRGIENLKATLLQRIRGDNFVSDDSPIVTNMRHHDALHRAQKSLRIALKSIIGQMPLEVIAVDLRSSLDAMGEIVGKTTTEDILDRIFSQFCVGK